MAVNAAKVMGALSQRRISNKSKLPPRPMLSTRPPAPVKLSAPGGSDKDEVQISGEMKEPKKGELRVRTLTHPGGCVNWRNAECDSRRVLQKRRLHIDYSVRQCQRKTNFKASKPLPYLTPVSSYCRTRKQQFTGRSGQERRKIVTCIESIKYGQLEVAKSEELLPKPELAYLIVDLKSGTPLFDFGKKYATSGYTHVLSPRYSGSLCV